MKTRKFSISKQQRKFVYEYIVGNNYKYTITDKLKINGIKNVLILKKAIRQVVTKNIMLRVKIIKDNGEYYNIIIDNHDGLFREIDKSKIKAVEESKLDMMDCRLFVVYICYMNRNNAVLILKWHHAVVDGWSLRIFYKKVTSEINGELNNHIDDSYMIYSCEKENNKNVEMLKKRIKKRTMKNKITFANDERNIKIVNSKYSIESIVGKCEQYNCNIFTLISGLIYYIYYTSIEIDNITIGLPLINRNDIKYYETIGLFVNSAILDIKFNKDDGKSMFIKKVNKEMKIIQRNQNITIEEMYRKEKGPLPTIDIWLNVINYGANQLELKGCQIESGTVDNVEAIFDVNIYVVKEKHEIRMTTVYDSNKDDKYHVKKVLNKLSCELGYIEDQNVH